LCDALAERACFERLWFKGGVLLGGVRALQRGGGFAYLRQFAWPIVRLRNRNKAPQDLYPVPHVEVRHKDVVREAHKQYSETLNELVASFREGKHCSPWL
jgi:hypothetical protein